MVRKGGSDRLSGFRAMVAVLALSGLMASPASGAFVAVGDHAILRSADGVSWSNPLASMPEPALGLAYGQGTWVAVSGATFSTSLDGRAWVAKAFPASVTGVNANAVSYDEGLALWVAVGRSGTILTSPGAPGWVWTDQPNTANGGIGTINLSAVAGGGGLWVAVGAKGTILASTDRTASSWLQPPSGTANDLHGIAYGGTPGQWVAVGDGGTILTSPDGLVWTAQCPPPVGAGTGCTTQPLFGVSPEGAQWTAVGAAGTVLASPDAKAWTLRPTGTDLNLAGLGYAHNAWVAFGQVILTSGDGAAWVRRESAADPGLATGAYGNGRWILGQGMYGGLVTSTDDGATWQVLTAQALSTSMGVVYDGGQWVVSDGQVTLTSADGLLWTGHDAGLLRTPLAKAYGQGLWVGVRGTAIDTSQDGLHWTQVCGPGGPACPICPAWKPNCSNDLQSVAYGDGKWVAVGNYGLVLTSTDGFGWTQSAGVAAGMSYLYNVAYNGTAWLAISNGIASSADGAMWTQACPAPPGTGASCPCPKPCGVTNLWSAQWGGGQWVVVGGRSGTAGNAGAVLRSPDASAWSLCDVCPDLQMDSVAYDGTHWVAVGKSGRIFTSPDADTWTTRDSTTGQPLASVATSIRPLECAPATQAVFVGQGATLQASGGTPPYSWSAPGGDATAPTGAASLGVRFDAPGAHEVLLQDGGTPGQSARCLVTVGTPPPPTLSCLPASQTVALGSRADLAATGGTPAFTWNVAGTPVAQTFETEPFATQGTYLVNVTDSGSPPQSASCIVVVEAPVPPPPATPGGPAQPVRKSVGRPSAGAWTQGSAPSMPGGSSAPPAAQLSETARHKRAEANPPTDQPPVPGVDALSFDAQAISRTRFVFRAEGGHGAFGWDFGDGSPAAAGASAGHVYQGPGTYLVRLTFIGPDGRIQTAQSIVVVAPGPLSASPASAMQPTHWGWMAGAAVVLVALAWLVRRAWPNFLLAFFSRLRQSDLAKHPVRSAILDLLATHQGLQETALARLLDRDRTTIAHHLRVLAACGLVQVRHWEGTKAYFLGPKSATGQTGVSVLPSGKAQAILDLIAARPGIAYTDLVRSSGYRKTTVGYHLDRLRKAGLVSTASDGPRVRLWPSKSLQT